MRLPPAANPIAALLLAASLYLCLAAAGVVRAVPGLSESPTDMIVVAIAVGALGVATLALRRYRQILDHLSALQVQPAAGDDTDPLTKLLNRTAFLDQLDSALDEHRNGRTGVGVLIVDIDRFKQINEIHGHVTADSVLVEVARRLAMFGRNRAVVARLGTDEFGIMTRADTLEDLYGRLVGRIFESIGAPVGTGRGSLRVSVSIGAATSDLQAANGDALLRAADIALRVAKREARGQFRVFEAAMAETLRVRSTLESGLKRALMAGEIVPYYQPLVALDTGRLTGFEVLARWNHPVHGVLPPSAFIPLAEEIGQIGDLFRQLLTAACQDAREWSPDTGLSINVSPTQFADPFLASQILNILSDTGFDAKRLELEITESALVDQVSSAHMTLTALREVGVTVALDDFGTGYSNLHNLSELPIDRLKIDRVFVEQARQNIENWKIVRAIVQFAHALNLETTAEGIELADVADVLRDVGCDIGQGYLFGRPQPAEITTSWMAELAGAAVNVYPKVAT